MCPWFSDCKRLFGILSPFGSRRTSVDAVNDPQMNSEGIRRMLEDF